MDMMRKIIAQINNTPHMRMRTLPKYGITFRCQIIVSTAIDLLSFKVIAKSGCDAAES